MTARPQVNRQPQSSPCYLTEFACQATKQSEVGDVRLSRIQMLWSAPSLGPYVATPLPKSKRKSIMVDQASDADRASRQGSAAPH